MRAKVLFICLLFACGACAQVSEGIAKNKVYQGFSGGMMLHTGYLFGQDGNAPKTADGRLCSPQGALFGIGGALRVHLWKYLRTGFEGFVSTMPSAITDCRDVLKNGSYVRVGCGGVLADLLAIGQSLAVYRWHYRRWFNERAVHIRWRSEQLGTRCQQYLP